MTGPRIFEFGIILSVAGAMVALYFIGRAKNMEQKTHTAKADLELKGKVFMARFENGQLRLASSGRDLLYQQESGEAVFSQPAAEIFDPKGPVRIQSREARYYQEEGRIRFQDDVMIDFQGYRATTATMDYQVKDELATGDGEIRIEGKDLNLTGKGFVFDGKKGEMELKSRVKGKIQKVKTE